MKHVQFIFCISLFCWIIPSESTAQLLINELCAVNKSVILDGYGKSSDWIEIYNSSSENINLQEFQLSDNPSDLNKFQLPNLVINSGEFLIVFASDDPSINDEVHSNFKLSSSGEFVVISNNNEVIDQIQFPKLADDQSFGRKSDGENEWGVFDIPSPGISNNNSMSYDLISKPIPSFITGFYDEALSLELKTGSNNIIRYTKDGKPVTISSDLYIGSISINNITNIRAKSFDDDNHEGEELNQVYFINSNHKIPVIHLSTDPDNLYDWNNGIFVKGPDANPEYPFYGANFWKDIEIPVHFDYFIKNNHVLSYQLGAKIHGGKASRSKPMQSLRLIADKDFGEEWMDYKFFDESDITLYKRLVLRNASGDYNHTHFRDGYMARYFAKEKLNLDLLQFQPTVVYINGVYYGLLHIREKIDKHYIKTHYNLEAGAFDLLEKDTQVVEGNYEIFNNDRNYILNNDMSIDENFAEVEKRFDVGHIIDYVACQSVVNNTDWPRNNIKFWKAHEDGRWRYFLFDMDVAMGRHGWTTAENNYLGDWVDTLSNARFYDMLVKLWENESYQERFTTRYADLLNSTFKAENWLHETVNTKERLEDEIKLQMDTWSDNAFEWWTEKGIPRLYQFTEEREVYAREFLRQRFNYTEPISIRIVIDPPLAGDVQINTINPKNYPWDGFYFEEIPVELSVNENQGYTFSHWEINQIDNNITEKNISYNYKDGAVIRAVFNGEFHGMNPKVFPSPSSSEFNVDLIVPENGKILFEIFNTAGKVIGTFESDELFAGKQSIVINHNIEIPGIYFLQINSGTYNSIVKVIIQP